MRRLSSFTRRKHCSCSSGFRAGFCSLRKSGKVCLSQEAKKAAKKAKQRDRERARKAATASKRVVSKAEAAEDEVARAALEAAALAQRCAACLLPMVAQRSWRLSSIGQKKLVTHIELMLHALVHRMHGGAQQEARRPAAATPAHDAAKRREVMAAAAEARLSALQAATASQQLWSALLCCDVHAKCLMLCSPINGCAAGCR